MLAKKYQIHVLTNYETSWYETNVKANDLLEKGAIGQLRKVIRPHFKWRWRYHRFWLLRRKSNDLANEG